MLIVLVAVIVGVVLGVFLSGGDEEDGAPARTAAVESETAAAAKQEAAPESAATEGVQSEAVQPESAETASVQSEAAQPVSDQPDIVAKEAAREAEPVPPEEPVRVQEEPSVARAAPEDAGEAAPDATPPAPAVTPPSFDVVRVSPSGQAVIAGRAKPGAEVTVLDDGMPLGTVQADKRGEWVLVPEKSLAGGDRELSLVQDLPNGDRMQSEQVIVPSVPRPLDKPVAAAADVEAGGTTATAVAEAEAETPAQPKTEAETVAMAEATEAAPTEDASGATEVAAAESAPAAADSVNAMPVEEKANEGVIAVLVEREGDGPSRILQSPEVGGEGIGIEADVTIRSVDYDAEGDVTLAGRTEPNAVVNVYVDEAYVGSTRATAEGDWQLSPEQEVLPGQHRLRIDKVDQAGIVLARIETPISRANSEELLLGDALVVVQPGNSLWRIARRAYGGGIYYSEIYGANRAQILDPDMIFPGQILTLPVLN